MRFLAIALALTGVLALAPSASAAPCDADYRIEGDCWIDYVQPRINIVIDNAERDADIDLSLAQGLVNWAIDRAQDAVRPVFDLIPDHIPCVDPQGPHCW